MAVSYNGIVITCLVVSVSQRLYGAGDRMKNSLQSNMLFLVLTKFLLSGD